VLCEGRLSGSVRGRRATEGMEKILWHRRESRRKTEKTNIFLQPREAPAYSKNINLRLCQRGIVKGVGTEVFACGIMHLYFYL
jgi:hypothetical protein